MPVKAREFERWLRGWTRGLGHRWESSVEPDDRADGRRYLIRVMRCRACGARVYPQRQSRFKNFLVPYARHAGGGFFNRIIHLGSPDPVRDVRDDGRPMYPHFAVGGEQDPRFPRLIRSLASPCRDVQVAKATYYTMSD